MCVCVHTALCPSYHGLGVGNRYIEFNDSSWKYRAAKENGAAFFVRDYERMQELARNLETDGLTNYEKALKDALVEFAVPGTTHVGRPVPVTFPIMTMSE